MDIIILIWHSKYYYFSVSPTFSLYVATCQDANTMTVQPMIRADAPMTQDTIELCWSQGSVPTVYASLCCAIHKSISFRFMPDSYNSVSFSGELDVDPSHARAKWELRIFIVMITYIYKPPTPIFFSFEPKNSIKNPKKKEGWGEGKRRSPAGLRTCDLQVIIFNLCIFPLIL